MRPIDIELHEVEAFQHGLAVGAHQLPAIAQELMVRIHGGVAHEAVPGELLQQQATLFGDARMAGAFQRRVHQAPAGMQRRRTASMRLPASGSQ
jgi:hypothetical protein